MILFWFVFVKTSISRYNPCCPAFSFIFLWIEIYIGRSLAWIRPEKTFCSSIIGWIDFISRLLIFNILAHGFRFKFQIFVQLFGKASKTCQSLFCVVLGTWLKHLTVLAGCQFALSQDLLLDVSCVRLFHLDIDIVLFTCIMMLVDYVGWTSIWS